VVYNTTMHVYLNSIRESLQLSYVLSSACDKLILTEKILNKCLGFGIGRPYFNKHVLLGKSLSPVLQYHL
jgi:hypothetical protein